MFCPFVFDRLIQFSALLGDLIHRQDVHLHFQAFGPAFVPFFDSANQTAWLLLHHPDLVCDPTWNNHTVSTVFEHFYYSDLRFRLEYLRSL